MSKAALSQDSNNHDYDQPRENTQQPIPKVCVWGGGKKMGRGLWW